MNWPVNVGGAMVVNHTTDNHSQVYSPESKSVIA